MHYSAWLTVCVFVLCFPLNLLGKKRPSVSVWRTRRDTFSIRRHENCCFMPSRHLRQLKWSWLSVRQWRQFAGRRREQPQRWREWDWQRAEGGGGRGGEWWESMATSFFTSTIKRRKAWGCRAEFSSRTGWRSVRRSWQLPGHLQHVGEPSQTWWRKETAGTERRLQVVESSGSMFLSIWGFNCVYMSDRSRFWFVVEQLRQIGPVQRSDCRLIPQLELTGPSQLDPFSLDCCKISVAPNLFLRKRSAQTVTSDLGCFRPVCESNKKKKPYISPFCQLTFRWNAGFSSLASFSALDIFSSLWVISSRVRRGRSKSRRRWGGGHSILHPHNQHKWTNG